MLTTTIEHGPGTITDKFTEENDGLLTSEEQLAKEIRFWSTWENDPSLNANKSFKDLVVMSLVATQQVEHDCMFLPNRHGINIDRF